MNEDPLIQQLILNEIQEVRKIILELKEKALEESVKTYSLGDVGKILKLGRENILRLVHDGYLRAHTYRGSNNKIHYRFRFADIREYQQNAEYHAKSLKTDTETDTETTEVLARRLVNKYKRKLHG